MVCHIGYFLRDSLLHEGWKQAGLATEIAVNQAFRTARASRDFSSCRSVVALAGK